MPRSFLHIARVRAHEAEHPWVLELFEAAMDEQWRTAVGPVADVLGSRRLRLIDARVEYGYRPLHADDEVAVEVTVARLGSSSLTNRYVVSAGDEVVARGEAHYVCEDPTGRPTALPAAVRLALPGEAGEPLDVYERFVEAQRAFYRGGPVEPVAALLADHVTWDWPGGHHAGREAVLEYFAHRRDRTGATFEIRTHRVLDDAHGVVAFAGGRATIDGREHAWETIGVYDIAENHVVAGRLVALDPEAFAAVWL